MLRLIKTGIFWTGFLCLNFCYGQESDVLLGALPMQHNSSFAGTADQLRFSSNYIFRKQMWRDSYQSGIYTSLDQFVPAIGSGIGFHAGYTYSSVHEHTSQFALEDPSVYNIGIAVAPKFSIKGKITISPSIDYNYHFHKSSTWEMREYQSRVGLLINTARGYIGFSANLYSDSKVDNESDSSNLHYYLFDLNRYKFSFQLGYTFQRSSDSKFSFTPQLVVPFKYYRGKDFIIPKLMLNFRYDKILFGVSDVGVHAGWQTDRLRIIGSYNLQRLHNNSGIDIVNLAFKYTFKKNE